MEVWQLVLYGAAGTLSLRTLAGLMTAHKQRLLDVFEAEMEQRRREEEARVAEEKEAAAKEARKRAAGEGLRWPPPVKSDKAA